MFQEVGAAPDRAPHLPSSEPKRKANTAYRKAVVAEIEKTTGDADLAKKVRHLPMTDVVTAARLDADSIAKSAGKASYTDKDGHTTTVDVTPAGTTRRTPISKEAKAVLAEVDDMVGAFEPDTEFHTAVLNGDRAPGRTARRSRRGHCCCGKRIWQHLTMGLKRPRGRRRCRKVPKARR